MAEFIAGAFEFRALTYPNLPGVYRMVSASGKALYIGKARDLRKRLSQYFQAHHDGRFQLDLLLPQVAGVEVIVTESERDALVLENQLIKREKPKFNIRLKDDKTYPYIRLSKDEFPRIEVSRERDERNYDSFGPFTLVAAANRLVELIATWYGLRRCPGLPLKRLSRPCLYAQIGQCGAPCVGRVAAGDYAAAVEQARVLLKGGTKKAADEARALMARASGELNFEKAAYWRDMAHALAGFERRGIKDRPAGENLDAVACSHRRGWFMIAVAQVRGGLLCGSEVLQERAMAEWPAVLASFLMEYYSHREIPPLVAVDEAGEGLEDVEKVLSDRAGHAVRVHPLPRGGSGQWLVLARQNARAELSCREATGELGESGEYLERIRQELGLPAPPRRAIALDASIFGREEPVGGVVVFEAGRPAKAGYRHFRVRAGAGDPDFIGEVLERYLKRFAKDALPDAILIDGGLLQLDAAARALERAGHEPDQRLLAFAKGVERRSGAERLHIYGVAGVKTRAELPVSMRFLSEMRDEAHRFARRLGARRMANSRLGASFSRLPGIGPKSARVLRERFANLDELFKAAPEVIEALQGLGKSQKALLRRLILDQRESSA